MRVFLLLLLLASGSASAAFRAGFLEEFRVEGDLDGDGTAELARVLWQDPGGSGTFLYLMVVDTDAKGEPVATFVFLGDRVRVLEGRARDGRLELLLVRPGPGEPRCCGTRKVRQWWRLEGGKLRLLEERELLRPGWRRAAPAPSAPPPPHPAPRPGG